jgi:PAS domain-containing protein
MAPSRFRQAIAAIRRPRKGNTEGDRPDLSRHAARIIDEMAVATFVLDRDGRVAVWNDACARLTGIEAAKVIGTKDHWKSFYLAARPCLADLALEGGAAKVGSLYAAQGDGGRARARRAGERARPADRPLQHRPPRRTPRARAPRVAAE